MSSSAVIGPPSDAHASPAEHPVAVLSHPPQPALFLTMHIHRRAHLKAQGRCEVFKREMPEDANEDEFFTPDELEEEVDGLRAVEEDEQMPGEVPAWGPLLSSSAEAVKNQVTEAGAGIVCREGKRNGEIVCGEGEEIGNR